MYVSKHCVIWYVACHLASGVYTEKQDKISTLVKQNI